MASGKLYKKHRLINVLESYSRNQILVKKYDGETLFLLQRNEVPNIDEMEEEDIKTYVLEKYEDEIIDLIGEQTRYLIDCLECEIIDIEDVMDDFKIYKVNMNREVIFYIAIEEYECEQDVLEKILAHCIDKGYKGLYFTQEEYEALDEKGDMIYVDCSSYTKDIKSGYLDGIYLSVSKI